jgi:hypothetical protein
VLRDYILPPISREPPRSAKRVRFMQNQESCMRAADEPLLRNASMKCC